MHICAPVNLFLSLFGGLHLRKLSTEMRSFCNDRFRNLFSKKRASNKKAILYSNTKSGKNKTFWTDSLKFKTISNSCFGYKNFTCRLISNRIDWFATSPFSILLPVKHKSSILID